ncbi:LOW QUALITY PROTEIN: complement C1r subcomponent-like, partial [Stegostoma tigrinum]|uniref:LOW QUALITY PROTEIN: complement C1r subcomponent-like n=1 Tax=Stegostoma tigrinum TaxID=3053191 RepID=UPI0028701A8C
ALVGTVALSRVFSGLRPRRGVRAPPSSGIAGPRDTAAKRGRAQGDSAPRRPSARPRKPDACVNTFAVRGWASLAGPTIWCQRRPPPPPPHHPGLALSRLGGGVRADRHPRPRASRGGPDAGAPSTPPRHEQEPSSVSLAAQARPQQRVPVCEGLRTRGGWHRAPPRRRGLGGGGDAPRGNGDPDPGPVPRTVHCEELYSEISGHVESPEYPEAYPPNLRCNYSIRTEKGLSIRIEFADLFEIDSHDVVPCPYDQLTIESRTRLLGPLCGSERPEPIETRSDAVNIYFDTDRSGLSRGWGLRYTTDRIQCPDLPPLEHGSIRPAQDEYRFLDGVVFMCDTGYKIMKANTELKSFSTVCTGDGEWDKDYFPVCQIIDCGDPGELENGGFQLTHGSSVMNGYLSEIRYSCEKRYSMESEGDGTYTCTDSRHWLNQAVSERIPHCAPVCGRPDHPPPPGRPEVFGGVLAKEGNFPWQVLLQSNNFGLAGGILISDQWVLTAAHIFWPKDQSQMRAEQLKNFRVYLGGLSMRGMHETGANASVDRYYLHHGYSGHSAQFHHDIALVKLAQRVKMTRSIMPACLPSSDAPNLYRPRSLGYVAGWGITENNTLLDELRYVRLPLVRVGECARAMQRVQEQQGKGPREWVEVSGQGMMCAGTGLGGQDSCQGDSGGAFAMRDQAGDRWYAIGVVSWGVGCGQVGTYGVYTKVSHYRGWIDQVMATG